MHMAVARLDCKRKVDLAYAKGLSSLFSVVRGHVTHTACNTYKWQNTNVTARYTVYLSAVSRSLEDPVSPWSFLKKSFCPSSTFQDVGRRNA